MPHTRPVPAVGAIILQDDTILLIRRGVEPYKGMWSVPAGSVEWGETLEEALRREVREETGLDIRVDRLAGLRDLIVTEGEEIAYHYILINFFAEVIGGTPAPGDDADELRWVPLAHLHELPITPSLLAQLGELGLVISLDQPV